MFRPSEWPPWSREDAEQPEWHPFDQVSPFVRGKAGLKGNDAKSMDFWNGWTPSRKAKRLR